MVGKQHERCRRRREMDSSHRELLQEYFFIIEMMTRNSLRSPHKVVATDEDEDEFASCVDEDSRSDASSEDAVSIQNARDQPEHGNITHAALVQEAETPSPAGKIRQIEDEIALQNANAHARRMELRRGPLLSTTLRPPGGESLDSTIPGNNVKSQALSKRVAKRMASRYQRQARSRQRELMREKLRTEEFLHETRAARDVIGSSPRISQQDSLKSKSITDITKALKRGLRANCGTVTSDANTLSREIAENLWSGQLRNSKLRREATQ